MLEVFSEPEEPSEACIKAIFNRFEPKNIDGDDDLTEEMKLISEKKIDLIDFVVAMIIL